MALPFGLPSISNVVKEESMSISTGRSFEDRVFARFDAIDAWRGSTDHRFDRIESHLEALEMANEKRAVESKLAGVRVLAEIIELKNAVADLSRKIEVLNRDIITVRADQLRLDDRLDRIESEPS